MPLDTQGKRFCTITGCGKPLHGRGLCRAHNWLRLKNGDPLILRRKPNGSGCFHKQGYILRMVAGVQRLEHVRIAERALGKHLPKGAQVHHFDENKTNNAPDNLVICPNYTYHALLHARQKALAACGNPDWRRCRRCGKYDDPTNLRFGKRDASHPECERQACKRYRESKKSATAA